MNLPSNSTGMGIIIIPSERVGWSPRGKSVQIPSGNKPTYEINKNFEISNVSGTNSGNLVNVVPPTVLQDTFLDNEIGEAVRIAKANFGKAPFIEAYKRVLDTSKKLDEEWRRYWEEEARLRSILEEDEDNVL